MWPRNLSAAAQSWDWKSSVAPLFFDLPGMQILLKLIANCTTDNANLLVPNPYDSILEFVF
jgi:hypothetical protein